MRFKQATTDDTDESNDPSAPLSHGARMNTNWKEQKTADDTDAKGFLGANAVGACVRRQV